MSAYYLSSEEITEAILRANGGTPQDGTYTLSGFWIGNKHGITAVPVTEVTGYEVAYRALETGHDLAYVEMETDRIGVWFDQETGIVHLDRTIHVKAPGGVALDIARLYSQKAIWSWEFSAVIETTDPATAL